MEFHEIANIFPMMTAVEYGELVKSIREYGYDKDDPIVLYEGKILDGRNRYTAAMEVGVEPVYTEFTGDDAIDFVVRRNLTRRHLMPHQIALAAATVANMKRGNPNGWNQVNDTKCANLHNRNSRVSQTEAADMFGISRRTVADAKKVIDSGASELQDAVRTGRASVSAAAQVATLPEPEQKEIVARGEDEIVKEANRIKKERQQKAREQREQEHLKTILTNPNNSITNSIKLFCDDAATRVPLLEDDSISLVVTDPPYNVTDYEWDKLGAPDEYLNWLFSILTNLRPKLKKDYHLFMFCDPDYMADIEMRFRQDDWPIKSRIIWEYRNLVNGRDVKDKFIDNYQVCFHIGTHPLNWPIQWDDRRFAVQNHAAPQSNFSEGKYHPHQKPLELITLLVELGSDLGDIVLDMFAGSGTTGKACAGKRQCVLIEQSNEYCKIMETTMGIERVWPELPE